MMNEAQTKSSPKALVEMVLYDTWWYLVGSSIRTQIMKWLEAITLACIYHAQSTHSICFRAYPRSTIESIVHKIVFQLTLELQKMPFTKPNA